MAHSLRTLLPLTIAFCGAAGGCAGSRSTFCQAPAREPVCGVVYVVGGAGNFLGLATGLVSVIREEQVPLAVEDFAWTHGPGRFIADQTDYGYAQAQGQQLAARVVAYRRACPNQRIYLVAHSAGSAVALAATEVLPADTVDRIVLLAPSVSSDYDLRAALRSTREGVDVFTSRRDWFYLGLGTGLVGTADRQWSAAAGRVGFHPIVAGPEDAALYGKLRQHPWEGCLAWTGNQGGHSGTFRPEYLRAYVLPLLRVE